jgi:hypothetical protein
MVVHAHRGAGTLCLILVVGAEAMLVMTQSIAAGESVTRLETGVFAATTPSHAELVETVPIGRREGQRKRVALSLGPARLPSLRRGDVLRVSAEVQLSVTCIGAADHRCIGRPYTFSPRLAAWIVLAGNRREVHGRKTRLVSEVDRMQCSQRRSRRNHHCVLVIGTDATEIGPPSRLPCRPERCHINLIVSASHPNAQPGNVVTVGADRPDGTVRQGQARLNAAVMRGPLPPPRVARSSDILHGGIPIAPDGTAGRRTVYSVKLPALRPGDVVVAWTRQSSAIGHLPYNVFIGSRLTLSTRPAARTADRIARRIGAPGGRVTEGNGFNCTHGPSAYRTPCLTRKVGMFQVRRRPSHRGQPTRLYINLVLGTLAKLHVPGPGDAVRPVVGGSLQAAVYSTAG